MKTLLRLQQLKNATLDRMTELNNLARSQGRDLTEAEDIEYRLKLSLAEDLNGAIGLWELESQIAVGQETMSAPPAAQGPREIDFSLREGFDKDAPWLRLR